MKGRKGRKGYSKFDALAPDGRLGIQSLPWA
jgi:hypothetical protein